MTSDLRDWFAAASGRVYSEATVHAAEPLRWHRRVAVRFMAHRGAVPTDRREREFATALARDLDRMMPRNVTISPWVSVVAGPIIGVIAALESNWLFLVVVAATSVVQGALLLLQRNDREALRTVVLAGYAQLTVAEKAAFDRSVREPARFTPRQRVVGLAAHTLVVATWAFFVAAAIQWSDRESDWWVLSAVFTVVFVGCFAWSADRARQRFTREILGEPRPQQPAPSVANPF